MDEWLGVSRVVYGVCVWYGMVWFGVVWFGVVWYMVWCMVYGIWYMVKYSIVSVSYSLTNAVPVVILVPPDAPAINTTSPLVLFVRMIGLMDDIGRLPGAMKLLGEGSTPYALIRPGVEKSSISLLYIIPVIVERTFDPKLTRGKNT